MKPSSEPFGSQTASLTREQWLGAITSLLRPRFAAIGSPVPQEIAISCGWPSQNGRARHNRVIGECWKVEPSAVGRPEIFVSPMLADSIEVGAVLVHELMHAAHPDAGHKGASKFKRAALALGLTGRMTATSPGDQLRHDLVALVEQIGQAVSPRRDPRPHRGAQAEHPDAQAPVSRVRVPYPHHQDVDGGRRPGLLLRRRLRGRRVGGT